MNNILFVFEGEDTESLFVNSLNKNILGEETIIECVYAGDIYQLYRKIKESEYLDTFELLKERCVLPKLRKSKEVLDKYTRDDIAEIYLFFDYDGQAIQANDEQIKELLAMFDNETEQGKLLISYPMVEAIKHIKDYLIPDIIEVKCKGQNCPSIDECNEKGCLNEPHYKAKASNECNKDLNEIKLYTKKTWLNLIHVHLLKMNYIVNNVYQFPTNLESQHSIFESQVNKYLSKHCPTVAVLSAFPVFVHDYYGNEKTKRILQDNIL